jgi:hypothetical protein
MRRSPADVIVAVERATLNPRPNRSVPRRADFWSNTSRRGRASRAFSARLDANMKMPKSAVLNPGVRLGGQMRNRTFAWGVLFAVGAIFAPAAARAGGGMSTTNYAVTRNGDPIGAATVRLLRDGRQTVAVVATDVQVKIAEITVYRFEQRETEHWADGRLLAMTSVTDDNGTVHRVSAQSRGNALSVDADGRVSTVNPAVIPVSLWNASLVNKTVALDPQSGRLTPVSVVDHGEERLVLQGRPTVAHHYSITTDFAQEVWYDQQHRLVKAELHASDGSDIEYKLG